MEGWSRRRSRNEVHSPLYHPTKELRDEGGHRVTSFDGYLFLSMICVFISNHATRSSFFFPLFRRGLLNGDCANLKSKL